MPEDLAAIDTSVLLLMVTPEAAVANADQRVRVVRAQQRMVDLRKNGVRFFVPSPVIAELSRDGTGEDLAAKRSSISAEFASRVSVSGLRASPVKCCGRLLRRVPKTRARPQ
jgi:rRNA-processing protein FCF1